jgi:hypothetical protein
VSKSTNEPQATTFLPPVEPLPPSNPRLWRKLSSKPLAYALGSLATVEEITGNKLANAQVWRWRIIRFGAPKPQNDTTRERAMRAAEFLLGVGEMEVEK